MIAAPAVQAKDRTMKFIPGYYRIRRHKVERVRPYYRRR